MSGLLTHRVDGSGEALLLLNGGLMSVAAWEPMMPRLTASFQVIRCDFRGQLLSLGLGAPPQRFEDHATDLIRMLDGLSIDRVHLVGASFGALVALQLAAQCPSRVRSLVAVTATDAIGAGSELEVQGLRGAVRAAAAGGDGRPVLDLIAPYTFSPSWLAENRALFETRRAQFSLLPRAWFAGLDGLLAALEHLDLRPLLGRIQAPTLVVGAECDRTFPLPRSRALAATIPGASLVVVRGAPHGLVAERPDTLLDAILPFLLDHSMRGSS